MKYIAVVSNFSDQSQAIGAARVLSKIPEMDTIVVNGVLSKHVPKKEVKKQLLVSLEALAIAEIPMIVVPGAFEKVETYVNTMNYLTRQYPHVTDAVQEPSFYIDSTHFLCVPGTITQKNFSFGDDMPSGKYDIQNSEKNTSTNHMHYTNTLELLRDQKATEKTILISPRTNNEAIQLVSELYNIQNLISSYSSYKSYNGETVHSHNTEYNCGRMNKKEFGMFQLKDNTIKFIPISIHRKSQQPYKQTLFSFDYGIQGPHSG